MPNPGLIGRGLHHHYAARACRCIVLSIETHESAEEEREILRLLARGEREIAQGTGYSLKKVMAEADRLLAEEEQ